MKDKTSAAFVVGSILTVAFGVAMWSPAISQQPEPKRDKVMMEGCQAMMDEKKQMTTDMKKEDTELKALAAKMNSAPADQKVELMAALLTRVIEQRSSTNARMASFDDAKMQHMMKHMSTGMDTMEGCPMMGGMGRMDGMGRMEGMGNMDGMGNMGGMKRN